MKNIYRFVILSVVLLGCCITLSAQTVVTGKYKGHIVKVRYYKGVPDDIEYLEYGLVDKLEKELQSQKDKVTQAEKENKALRLEVDKLKKQVKGSGGDNTRIRQLEQELLQSGFKIDTMVITIDSLSESLNSKITAINTLNQQIKELQESNIGQSSNPDVKLLAKISELEKSIENKTTEIKGMSNDIASKTSEISQLGKDLDKKNKEISKLQKEIDQKEKKIAELLNELNNSGSTNTSLSDNKMQFGFHYRIGLPMIVNSFLKQTDNYGQLIWHKNQKLSHNVGFQWSSASLSKKTSILIGVGLEYSRIKLSVGIGNLNETIEKATDADLCPYTAYLSYHNIDEEVTLSYISIPLTLTLGQPHSNHISGYGQFTIAPAFCIGKKLQANGTYNLAGHYSKIGNYDVDLFLEDFKPLGFGKDLANPGNKNTSVNTFVLFGRVSGGVYIPLCNLKKGKTSSCILKMGVNLDLSITPLAKKAENNPELPDAHYNLNEYNILSGSNSRVVNPNFEIGLIYIFNPKKNGK